MNVSIVSRKISDKWEAALVSDRRFLRAMVSKDIFQMITESIAPYLVNRPEGTELEVALTITEPSEEPTKINEN